MHVNSADKTPSTVASKGSTRKKLRSLTRPDLQQSPLIWSLDMEEAAAQPPHMMLLDPYFVVYRGRRRKLISASRLQSPPPRAAMYRKMKQNRTAGSPWFRMGHAPCGA